MRPIPKRFFAALRVRLKYQLIVIVEVRKSRLLVRSQNVEKHYCFLKSYIEHFMARARRFGRVEALGRKVYMESVAR